MGRLHRLRGMPTSEIGYRLRERVRCEAERLRCRLHVAPAVPEPRGGYLSFLQRAFAAHFYLAPSDRDSIRSFVIEKFPEWQDAATCEAEMLCDHRLELLGLGEVSLGRDIDWHRDPITGAPWPRHFWADYDPVNNASHGDSKVIHELNRQQHLPRLAKAYFLTGEERYAREAVAQIETWIAQNPEGVGINWQSSLEIAIRALSWLWTIFFLSSSPAFTEGFARHMTQSLLAQLRHVANYPSIYSSPNTHLIGESAALFIAGQVFAELGEEAVTWRNMGAALLTQEAERQILDDGVHCELSTCYHCYAADFFIQALILGQRNGSALPPNVASKIAQMFDFVMHMTRSDGTLPQLGDDDGGRALALSATDYRSYVDGLCLAACAFQRPEFKWRAGGFREEALWLLGTSGWQCYDSLHAVPPRENSRAFKSAGYFVARTGPPNGGTHAVFDCGGLGAPTGGHGHADALSLVLFSGGRDLLIDPGTGAYNANPEWRSYFRSTAAHNTVVVDGCDQSEPAGTFRWADRATANLVAHRTFGELHCVEGQHDGYMRLTGPVQHKRRLLFSASDAACGDCLISDEFDGLGEHTFDLYYHFAPGVDLRVINASDRIDVVAHAEEWGATLCFHTGVPTTFEVLRGWVSPRYGRREAANVLRLSIKTIPPLVISTVLVPFQKGRQRCAESAAL
jgi:uncharacterized heparinase superfamily protein